MIALPQGGQNLKNTANDSNKVFDPPVCRLTTRKTNKLRHPCCMNDKIRWKRRRFVWNWCCFLVCQHTRGISRQRRQNGKCESSLKCPISAWDLRSKLTKRWSDERCSLRSGRALDVLIQPHGAAIVKCAISVMGAASLRTITTSSTGAFVYLCSQRHNALLVITHTHDRLSFVDETKLYGSLNTDLVYEAREPIAA